MATMVIPKNIERHQDVIITNYKDERRDHDKYNTRRLCVIYFEDNDKIKTMHMGVQKIGCGGLKCSDCVLASREHFDRWLNE